MEDAFSLEATAVVTQCDPSLKHQITYFWRVLLNSGTTLAGMWRRLWLPIRVQCLVANVVPQKNTSCWNVEKAMVTQHDIVPVAGFCATVEHLLLDGEAEGPGHFSIWGPKYQEEGEGWWHASHLGREIQPPKGYFEVGCHTGLTFLSEVPILHRLICPWNISLEEGARHWPKSARQTWHWWLLELLASPDLH